MGPEDAQLPPANYNTKTASPADGWRLYISSAHFLGGAAAMPVCFPQMVPEAVEGMAGDRAA